MKLLQINTTANWGSTGRIAEQIGERILDKGGQSVVAYGYYVNPSRSQLHKMGSKWSIRWHIRISKLFDRHGMQSVCATRRLIRLIKEYRPDIIHLHNIHGYYINYPMLFDYLQSINTPVVWTLHDCWTFTGRCAHYTLNGCYKWQSECHDCAFLRDYPKTYTDHSRHNFHLKRKAFTSLGERLTLVPVSQWLAGEARKSYFASTAIRTIYNGIDTSIFKPLDGSAIRQKYGIGERFMLTSVASAWSVAKGLNDLYELRKQLSTDYAIVMVGLTAEQLRNLPEGIIGIERTQSQQELAEIYSASDVVLSLSRQETFGMTVAEGMASGTPAIVYRTTSLPELVTPSTGRIVEQVGDIEGMVEAINQIRMVGKAHFSEACRQRAVDHFDKNQCFEQYIDLYESILGNTTK